MGRLPEKCAIDPALQFQTLEEGLLQMGLSLELASKEKLLAYLALLYKWNKTFSLTALHAEDQAVSHHLLDSLSILPFVPTTSLLDVGSGGGMPGLPLAIANPELQVTVIDSNSKKTAFLLQAAIELGLKNVKVQTGRVESFRPEKLFDRITSRAFADLADFVRLTEHLLSSDGQWLAMKGVCPDQEMAQLPSSVKVLSVDPLTVPGVNAARHVVSISSVPS